MPFLLTLKSLFFSKNLSSILIWILIALMAIIIIPNIGQISEKLGFETRSSLKEKLVKERVNTDTAIEANRINDNTINNLIITNELSQKAIEAQSKKEKATTDFVNSLVKDKDIKIANIKKQSRPIRKPTAVVEIDSAHIDDANRFGLEIGKSLKPSAEQTVIDYEDIEISKVQMASIWAAYCEFNTHQNCSDIYS